MIFVYAVTAANAEWRHLGTQDDEYELISTFFLLYSPRRFM